MSKCPHCGQAVTYQRCSKCGVECHGSFGEGMCEKCATAPSGIEPSAFDREQMAKSAKRVAANAARLGFSK